MKAESLFVLFCFAKWDSTFLLLRFWASLVKPLNPRDKQNRTIPFTFLWSMFPLCLTFSSFCSERIHWEISMAVGQMATFTWYLKLPKNDSLSREPSVQPYRKRKKKGGKKRKRISWKAWSYGLLCFNLLKFLFGVWMDYFKIKKTSPSLRGEEEGFGALGTPPRSAIALSVLCAGSA